MSWKREIRLIENFSVKLDPKVQLAYCIYQKAYLEQVHYPNRGAVTNIHME